MIKRVFSLLSIVSISIYTLSAQQPGPSQNLWGSIQNVGGAAQNAGATAINAVPGVVGASVNNGVVGAEQGVMGSIPGAVGGLISGEKPQQVLQNLGQNAMQAGIGAAESTAMNAAGSIMNNAMGQVSGALGGVAGSIGNSISGGIGSLFGSGAGNAVSGLLGGGGGLGSMMGGASGMMGGASGMLGGAAGSIPGVGGVMNAVTGGGGTDVIVMGGALAVTDKALNAINSDADKILSHVANIDANTANMNQVMAAKQALALSVAQMDLLATQGKVIQTDPLNPTATGVGANSMDTVVSAIAQAGQQNLGASPAMAPYMQGGMDPSQQQGYQQNGGATPAGPGGLVGPLQIGAGDFQSVGGLQSMGTAMLTQALSQIGSSVAGLIFNGFNSAMSFSGLNASNIDNIMGNAGQILAMDRVIPQVVVPLSGSMKSQLMPAGYTLTAEEAVNGKKLADGLYIRNETPYDAAYVSMVQKGTGADRMQFYAAIAEADIATYTPVSGNAAPGYGFRSAVNMNDALSAGAYNAVKAYNANVGGGPNPYATFAQAVAPIIPSAVEGKAPNSFLNISQSAIDAASKAPKVNLRNRGTLAQAVGAADMARYACAFKGFARPDACFDDYRLAQTASTATNAMVAVVTL